MLGDYAGTHPKKLWLLVAKWGTVRNYDIRRGIACCVLEHILEHHFDPYFDQSLAHIQHGNRRFAYTLAYCWKLGEAELPVNATRFNAFKSEAFPQGLAS